jgi:DNA helicase MCM9
MLPQPRSCPQKFINNNAANDNVNNANNDQNAFKCNSNNLREVEGSRVCVDYQEIKLQDHIERLTLGSVPRSILVILQAELVDKFNAGDDVIIIGELIRQWKPVAKGVRCSIQIAIQANNIIALHGNDRSGSNNINIKTLSNSFEKKFEQFWKHYFDTNQLMVGRNIILKSICPQLYGMFFVKLSLLLTIIGGNSTQYENGVRRRSQSHLLIVGDPGCGKSQLLRFASKILPRSVLTTGILIIITLFANIMIIFFFLIL